MVKCHLKQKVNDDGGVVGHQGVGEGVKLDIIKTRLGKTKQHIQGSLASTSLATNSPADSALNSTLSSEDSDAEEDAAMQSTKFLISSRNIHDSVDHMLIKLVALNEQGKLKSQ